MSRDDNDGQMIFGDRKLPDICLTDEEKPRKNRTQEICPDRRSNPGPLRDRRACYYLVHSGGLGSCCPEGVNCCWKCPEFFVFLGVLPFLQFHSTVHARILISSPLLVILYSHLLVNFMSSFIFYTIRKNSLVCRTIGVYRVLKSVEYFERW